MSCQGLGATAGNEGEHSMAMPTPCPGSLSGQRLRMHRGTRMSLLGTVPLALWCSQQFSLPVPDPSLSRAARVPPQIQPCRNRDFRVPQTPHITPA